MGRHIIVPHRAVEGLNADGIDAIGPFSDQEALYRFLTERDDCHGLMGEEGSTDGSMRNRWGNTTHVDPRDIDCRWCNRRQDWVS